MVEFTKNDAVTNAWLIEHAMPTTTTPVIALALRRIRTGNAG